MGQFDVCSVLTSLSVHKLPKITQTAWEQHTKHSKEVPPIITLIKFLEERRCRNQELLLHPNLK